MLAYPTLLLRLIQHPPEVVLNFVTFVEPRLLLPQPGVLEQGLMKQLLGLLHYFMVLFKALLILRKLRPRVVPHSIEPVGSLLPKLPLLSFFALPLDSIFFTPGVR